LKLGWYGYFQEETIEWATVFLTPLYAGGAMMFANFFPNVGKKKKFYYILVSSILLTIYEWLADFSGYFYHNKWKLWHSALAYPFILTIVSWNLMKIRQMFVLKR
jgi:uncharacterized membrane protein YvlD (DUF360 family)